MLGDAPEQLVRRLDHRATGSHQVAGAQHRQGIVGERRDHVRTVRSAARSRNRPRRQLAWLILLVLAALIALAARVDAAGAPAAGDDPIALAIRYADALAGGISDPARAPTLGDVSDADDDDDDDDGEAEDRDIDDPDDDLEEADSDSITTRELERDDHDRFAAPEPDDDSDPIAGRETRDGGGGGGGGGDLTAAAEPDDDSDDRGSIAVSEPGGDDGDDSGDLAAALGPNDGGAPGGDALAMLDAELDPGDVVASNDAVYAGGAAGAAEQFEQSLRHHRPSAWGRLDVGVSWRLRQSEPMHAPAHRASELWLVATWRR